MKYFNRHEHMSAETLKTIGEIIHELYSVDGLNSRFMYQNMFYGLYDGFDYTDQIHMDPDTFVVESKNRGLYEKILKVIKDIKSYPKHDHDVTVH